MAPKVPLNIGYQLDVGLLVNELINTWHIRMHATFKIMISKMHSNECIYKISLKKVFILVSSNSEVHTILIGLLSNSREYYNK